MQFQPICTELRIAHLLRHNNNCSLDTSTTVTKLVRHIDVIMVRPVIPHIAGIVVGYWRNGCSYRNIAREGVLDDHVKLMTRMTACCIALPGKTDEFSVQRLRRAWQPNVNFAVSRQTVNRRLVARAYRAR